MAEMLPPGFRITQVVQEFSRAGGVETVAHELQRCWERDGVPSEVLAATVGPDVPEADARHVRFALPQALSRRVATRGPWRYFGRTALVPAFTLAATARLGAARRKGRWAERSVILSHGDCFIADVIVLHAVNAASLAQKRRDGEWRWALNPMHIWVGARDRLMLRGLRARRYVAVSRRVVDELATFYRVPADRIAVIPNGTDLDRFNPVGPKAGLRAEFSIPADAPVLLFVGHEFDRKGLAHAIGALTHAGCSNAHLVAVGDGDAAGYAAMAEAQGVGSRMHFTGARTDLPSLYRDADAFVFPTAYETFSLVCMEALACGVPVFATLVGGIEDYLRDGVNGFAIERDSVDIGSKLAPFLANRDMQSRLRNAARATAADFGWPEVARRYQSLLLEVWREAHPRER